MYSFANKQGIIEIVDINTQEDINNLINQGYQYFSGINETKGEFFKRIEFLKNHPLDVDKCYGYDIEKDKLVDDENWRVRYIIATQGYSLDKLVNDEDWDVREAVADQGYGLDKLVNDEDWYVRRTVQNWLDEHNLTIEQYKKQYNKSCVNKSKSKQQIER